MIFKGSMNYTSNGRKRNDYATKGRGVRRRPFRDLVPTRKIREDERYTSKVPTACSTERCVYPTHSKSVAIAYNKGAYQVIPESEVKYIGK